MNIDAKYCPEIKCRWNSYSTYRFLMWACMMNEIAIASAPVDMSHLGFYLHSILYTLCAIFFGIPLVYSEICISQYTNCNIISAWNFCPILRGAGYGVIYFVILKVVFLIVLSSWTLEYVFYSALSSPPWFTCDDFNTTKCMVKRINITVFQHCIEAQNLFDEDCGMKTASSYFFEREIGENNTRNENCVFLWKIMLASVASSAALFIVLLKRDKYFRINVRILAGYVSVVLLLLFCIALSTSGTWYATKTANYWDDINYKNCINIGTQGVLACGVGSGIIGYLSRDVPFRSPATLTAVTVPLLSIFVTLILSLILFSGIKTVSYYHGEEERVLELGNSVFFTVFASVTEILSYFDAMPLWSFAWFSTIYLCLFVNISILYLFIFEYVTKELKVALKYKKISVFIVIFFTCILAWPFYCSDFTEVLIDVTEIMQLSSAFLFSFGLYWVYGFQKHNVDIIFMIGVKASYFWKIAWVTNPVWLFIMLFMRWRRLAVREYDNSYQIPTTSINVDELLVYLLLGIYYFIVILTAILHVRKFYRYNRIWNVFLPLPNWGPQDKILFRSRNMFVPEIMTREFLYRQVRIHGYSKKSKVRNVNKSNVLDEMSPEKAEWSALTSN